MKQELLCFALGFNLGVWVPIAIKFIDMQRKKNKFEREFAVWLKTVGKKDPEARA